jgi:DNA processing protein
MAAEAVSASIPIGADMADTKNLYAFLEALCAGEKKISPPEIAKLEEAVNRGEEILRECDQRGIAVLTPWYPGFPPALKAIPSDPLILYAKGNLELLKTDSEDYRAAAVIGTTSPSEDGRAAALRVTEALCGRGFTIVSGLAEGCDTAAHKACLACGGRTVAVLAHGLDYCYPRQNQPLAKAIVERGGILLSEYAPGETPRRNYFVARDRLQSGLSLGLCVIEAEAAGGTMHTVNFAEKQGRPIGCAPLPAGGNRLLLEERGAYPLGTGEEIERFIGIMTK